jgi:hypothetical protein
LWRGARSGWLFGSLGLALANGWRVERAERRAEAVRAHPAGSFEQHADQAIALSRDEDWRHDVRRELEKADFALWALSFGDDAA